MDLRSPKTIASHYRGKRISVIVPFYKERPDPCVPWYAKVVAGLVAAYAVSPIDLIPDFVPLLGYVDDLVIVPAGILLAVRLIPPELVEELAGRSSRSRMPC